MIKILYMEKEICCENPRYHQLRRIVESSQSCNSGINGEGIQNAHWIPHLLTQKAEIISLNTHVFEIKDGNDSRLSICRISRG